MYCHAEEHTSLSADTPAAQLTLILGKLHCFANEYLPTHQVIGEIPAYCRFLTRKKRGNDNINARNNLFGWQIDFTINSALKIYDVC